ncbi:hypothetical protein M3223_22310 [Paenibacillus pasadenensis]|uniref:hypothetical protein n=1 Tax=Paenibacillus pasadenensis TaxID=217090 RepID=UPI0020413716|nr:hypothetical protein [Paenibacillus pasadenensis]MCM3750072.1 hypothetical protein [Paenibacillus pasadenensis]
MTMMTRKNPGSVRSRKKRESLQAKQQQRLVEQLRQEEAKQLEEARKRREEERAKRREAEARMEELRLEEMLMREMERMRMTADRKRGKRLWTAEERMAQRAFVAALLETASASAAEQEAERSGYAEGWMPAAAAAGGRRSGGAGGARHAAAAERTGSRAQLELVPPQGALGSAHSRAAKGAAPPGEGGARDSAQAEAAPGALPLGRATAGQLQRLAAAVLAAAPGGRRRSTAAEARRRRRGAVRSPCGVSEFRLRLLPGPSATRKEAGSGDIS